MGPFLESIGGRSGGRRLCGGGGGGVGLLALDRLPSWFFPEPEAIRAGKA
jgi:hypothetical protein